LALGNEQAVRRAYQIAEDKDLKGWAAAFTGDGTFTDFSIGVTWTGPDELPEQVENYARAFPDMRRELYQFYVSGAIVVVRLALQGTHLGPLHLPLAPCRRPVSRQTRHAVMSSNWPRARLSASTATPKARSSSPGSASSATSVPRWSTDR
jgi:hypothetical protein